MLHIKSQTTNVFLDYKQMVKNRLIVQLKGEFMPLANVLEKDDVLHRCTCPHTSEQNDMDMVECRHHGIVERGFVMHLQAMYVHFWPYAFKFVVFLLNRLPIIVLNTQSLFQLLYDKQLDLVVLRVFRSPCFPFHTYTKHKLIST